MNYDLGQWSKGVVEWVEGDTAFLSVVFTWDLPQAYQRALWHRASGLNVRVGGPAVFTQKHYFDGVATVGGSIPDAVALHNPMATFASRGCPVGCYFCIVPAMEGKTFTELPDFPVRPVLCDNNLSALAPEYQQHIVDRYVAAGVPLLDANSGFEPRTFDEDVYARWRGINRGSWRFAYDDMGDRPHVERVAKMLRHLPSKKKRVYVLIGNEPMASCMERIRETIAWGCEPHVQPIMKLNTLKKKAWVRYDWRTQGLTDVARWVNGWSYKTVPFAEYDRNMKRIRAEMQAAGDRHVIDLFGEAA